MRRGEAPVVERQAAARPRMRKGDTTVPRARGSWAVLDHLHATIHAAGARGKNPGPRRTARIEPVLLVHKKGSGLANSQGPTFSDSLERVVKFAGIGTALLPLVGLVVRIVRFWGVPGGFDWMPRGLGLDIAAAQDVTHLTLSGFHADFVLVQWVVAWVVAWALVRVVLHVFPGARDWLERVRRHQLEFLLLILGVAFAASAFYAWYSFPIVGAAAMAVITLVGWWLIEQEVTSPGRPSWNSAIGAALAVGLAAAVANGSTYWQAQGEDLTFAPDPQSSANPLADGWYGELGRTSDQVFLTRCDGPGNVLVVAPSRIATITYASAPPRTRDTGFRNGPLEWSVGFQSGCSYP